MGSNPTLTAIISIHNHLGSPVAATNASGALLWREDYTPFGEARQQPAANDNGESYTGHIADTDTGLIYMQARYYDPAIGRFLSSDPVGFASGGPAYFNRYAYVGNNPINATDPTGMFQDRTTYQPGGPITGRQQCMGSCHDVDYGESARYATEAEEAPLYFAAFAIEMAMDGPAPFGDILAGVTLGPRLARSADNVGDAARLADDTLVCRGGTCNADQFTNGSGVTTGPDGILDGVSVESAPGATLEELVQPIPNGQVGVTTVGDVRAAGGDVVPSPTANRPNHATLSGVTADQAQDLFQPTIRNPNRD